MGAAGRLGDADSANETESEEDRVAYFGMGCFWGAERAMGGLGTLRVGYMGGSKADPTHKEVSLGKTGHAEVVQVRYSAKSVHYSDLLRVFWAGHDPTAKKAKAQYRSVMFVQTDEERRLAMESLTEAQLSRDALVLTEIEDGSEFYEAEERHQRYYAKQGVPDLPPPCLPPLDPAEEADVFVLDSDAGTDGQPGRRRSAVKQIFPSTAEEDPTQAHDGPVSPARTVQITDREASASASSTAAVAAAAAGAAADEPKPTVSQDTGGAATTPATPPPKTAVTRASPSRGTARAQKAFDSKRPSSSWLPPPPGSKGKPLHALHGRSPARAATAPLTPSGKTRARALKSAATAIVASSVKEGDPRRAALLRNIAAIAVPEGRRGPRASSLLGRALSAVRAMSMSVLPQLAAAEPAPPPEAEAEAAGDVGAAAPPAAPPAAESSPSPSAAPVAAQAQTRAPARSQAARSPAQAPAPAPRSPPPSAPPSPSRSSTPQHSPSRKPPQGGGHWPASGKNSPPVKALSTPAIKVRLTRRMHAGNIMASSARSLHSLASSTLVSGRSMLSVGVDTAVATAAAASAGGKSALRRFFSVAMFPLALILSYFVGVTIDGSLENSPEAPAADESSSVGATRASASVAGSSPSRAPNKPASVDPDYWPASGQRVPVVRSLMPARMKVRLTRRLGTERGMRRAMSSALVSMASEAFLSGALAAQAPFAAAARAYRYASSGLLPPLEEGKPAAQGGEPAETWPASGRNAPPVRALDPARIKVRLTRRMASAKAVRRAMSGALHSMSSQIFLAGAHAARAPLAVAARAYRLAASGARLSLSSHCQEQPHANDAPAGAEDYPASGKNAPPVRALDPAKIKVRLTLRLAAAKKVRHAMSGALHAMSSQVFVAGASAARAPFAAAARAYRIAGSGAPAEEEHRTQESAAAAAEAWPASGRNKAAVRALQPTRYPVRLTRRLAASDRIRAATNALAIAANKSYKSVANLFRGRGAKGGAGGKGEGGLEEAKKEQDQAMLEEHEMFEQWERSGGRVPPTPRSALSSGWLLGAAALAAALAAGAFGLGAGHAPAVDAALRRLLPPNLLQSLQVLSQSLPKNLSGGLSGGLSESLSGGHALTAVVVVAAFALGALVSRRVVPVGGPGAPLAGVQALNGRRQARL